MSNGDSKLNQDNGDLTSGEYCEDNKNGHVTIDLGLRTDEFDSGFIAGFLTGCASVYKNKRIVHATRLGVHFFSWYYFQQLKI